MRWNMKLKGFLALIVCVAVAGVTLADDGMGYDKPKWVDSTCSSNSAQVTWGEVPNTNLTGYNVYYKPAGETVFEKANAELVTVTEFTITGLLNGMTYDFGVIAVYADSGLSPLSDPATCTTG